MKYPKMQWGRMEAVINKLGGEYGVDQFLSGQTEVVPVVGNEYAVVLDTTLSGIQLLKKGEVTEERNAVERWSLDSRMVSPRTRVFRLINLGQEFANEDDALELLSVPGFRAAGIEDLLVFGALAKPKEKGIFVVAPDAYLNGQHWATWGIGYPKSAEEKRVIATSFFRDGYGEQCRFLMVKNS